MKSEDVNFIKLKKYNQSSALYYFYKNYKKVVSSKDDKEIFKNRFNLTPSEFEYIKIEVDSLISKNKAFTKEKVNRLKRLEKELKSLEDKFKDNECTKKERRRIVKVRELITYIKDSLTRDITFGGKDNLKNISRFSNKIKNLSSLIENTSDSSEKDKLVKQLDETKNSLNVARENFNNNRVRSLYIVGETQFKGNRYFDFSELTKGVLYYKPNRSTRIAIPFYSNKLSDIELLKLQELALNNVIPITVHLSENSVSLIYDNNIVNHYVSEDKKLEKEVDVIKDGKILKIYKPLVKQHILNEVSNNLSEKTKDLNLNRTLAIDLNPEYIGCSIVQTILGNKEEVEVIYKFCYVLTNFIKKLPRNYTQNQRTHHNNKHKFEITQIIKQIVKIAKHYKCASVSMEDLHFKTGDSGNGTGFNRITKNVWHRMVIEQALAKQTNIHGLLLKKVDPRNTSLIGNIKYKFFDPVSASCEIGRRGLLGWKKDKEDTIYCKYPTVNESVVTAVQDLLRVDDSRSIGNLNEWSDVRTALKETRYRWVLSEFEYDSIRMSTWKSGIIKYVFN